MVDHRRLAPDFKYACRQFEKVERRYWRADLLYSRAADGTSLARLKSAYRKFRLVERELSVAYAAMSKASRADTRAHYVYIKQVIEGRN